MSYVLISIAVWLVSQLAANIVSLDHNLSSDITILGNETIGQNPLIGVCLKRYTCDASGAKRNDVPVDIPLEIRIPHFTSDEGGGEEKVKLSLQSFICHQGTSISSGHYISYIRGTAPIVDGDYRSNRKLSNANRPPGYSAERWTRFNDLAIPRVEHVDVKEALRTEMPYLLFYQLQSYSNVSLPDLEPPSYNTSTCEATLMESPLVEPQQGYFDGAVDSRIPSIQFFKAISHPESQQSLHSPENNIEYRRGSLAFTDNSMTSTANSVLGSQPSTPIEETTAQRMARAAQKFTRSNKSRPPSQCGETRNENRISATFSRLNIMKSKEQLEKYENPDPRDSTAAPDTVVKSESEPRRSINFEAPTDVTEHLNEVHPNVRRSRSRKGKDRKRDKSMAPSEKAEGHHHHGHRERVQDRECQIM